MSVPDWDWDCAHRLLECGARTSSNRAATFELESLPFEETTRERARAEFLTLTVSFRTKLCNNRALHEILNAVVNVYMCMYICVL